MVTKIIATLQTLQSGKFIVVLRVGCEILLALVGALGPDWSPNKATATLCNARMAINMFF